MRLILATLYLRVVKNMPNMCEGRSGRGEEESGRRKAIAVFSFLDRERSETGTDHRSLVRKTE